jgi:hypothetical protein
MPLPSTLEKDVVAYRVGKGGVRGRGRRRRHLDGSWPVEFLFPAGEMVIYDLRPLDNERKRCEGVQSPKVTTFTFGAFD